jgi:beta-phosphoglucomutase
LTLAGVIFDFDGVLADSEPLHLRAYQDVLAQHGMALAPCDYYDRYLGFDDVGVFRTVSRDQGRELDEDTLAELIRVKGERFDTLAGQGEGLFPGAADCIRRAATAAPVAIASGALAPEIDTVLAAADLRRYFRAIVASGDTPRSKPAPDPYLRALELLRPHIQAAGLDPGGCVVAVEDSMWGIESALAAGLRCVGVAQTYAASRLGTAHVVVPTIADVTPETLRTACGRGAPAC